MAIPTITKVRGINGVCVSDCSIVIEATNLGANVKYGLIDYPEKGQVSMQPENRFDNLEPGTYTVAVYDNTTGDNPVTGTVKVTTTYNDFYLVTPTTSNNKNNGCVDNGIINVGIIGGKAPYVFRITGPVSKESTASWGSTSGFYDLPSGDYTVEAEDACGQIRRSKPGEPVKVESYVSPFKDKVFESLTLTFKDLNTNVYGTTSVCDKVEFKIHRSDINLQAETYGSLPSNDATLEYCIESPVGSGNWSERVKIYNGYFYFSNVPYTQGGSFRLKLYHPCTGDEIISNDVSYPIEPSKFTYTENSNGRTYTDFCHSTENPKVVIDLSNYETSKVIRDYVCGEVTYTLKKGDVILNVITTKDKLTLTKEHGLVGGETYTVDIETEYGKTYPAVTFKVPDVKDPLPLVTDYAYFDHNYVKGTNYGTKCDFDHAKVYSIRDMYWDYYVKGLKIKYTILEPAGFSDKFPPVEVTSSGALWEDIPYGTYKIREEYQGCPPQDVIVELPKVLKSFELEEVTYMADPGVCGMNKLQATGYYLDVDGNRFEKRQYMRPNFYMQIVEGPTSNGGSPTKGRRSKEVSPFAKDNNPAVIDNLPGGTYKVIIYSVDAPTKSGMPECWYAERTIDIPYNQAPKLNVPKSGGISCSSSGGNAKLTLTGYGTNGPFLYRYKVKDAPNDTYYPADFSSQNVFEGLNPGVYTVQIMDRCGDVGMQDITIYNNGDQLIEINGNVSNEGGGMVVCRGQSLTLQVKSIGPVASYQWFKSETGLDGTWTELTNAGEHYSYQIPNVKPEDKGYYKVEINNTACLISSVLQISEVKEPVDAPIIKGPAVICPGTTFVLEAETNIPAFSFQWYRDGEVISDAVERTYITNLPGEYTVTLIPADGCISALSAVHMVIADASACAVANDDEIYMDACERERIADVLANDITGGCTDIAIKVAPKNGKAEVVLDGGISKIKYTPSATFIGVDYLTYEIVCSEYAKFSAKLKITVGSKVMVETINDASEAGILGQFRIRFTCQDVKYNKTLRISYNIGGSAIPEVDYVPLSGLIDLPKGKTSVDLNVEARKNYLVQGNRTVEIEIVRIEELLEVN